MTTSLKPLNQQVVVITGASSGIGLATALEAAARGAKLVLAARSAQTLEAIVADITSAGGEAGVDAPESVDRRARDTMPSPQIDPHRVAEAILSAATSPARDVKVGAMAKLNTLAAKLIPGLGDKMFAKQVNTQHYDEPPRDPDGTLYRAGESGRTHGSGGVERPAE